jgi:hypothetical protein
MREVAAMLKAMRVVLVHFTSLHLLLAPLD